MFHVDALNPIGLGNDGQLLADLVFDLLPKEGYADPSEFDDNEGRLISEACKKDDWAFVPQSGGFEPDWLIDIRVSGATSRYSKYQIDDLVESYIVDDDLIDDWKENGFYGLLFPKVMQAIEAGSENHYSFS
jgi:hypothetical protein